MAALTLEPIIAEALESLAVKWEEEAADELEMVRTEPHSSFIRARASESREILLKHARMLRGVLAGKSVEEVAD